MHHEARARLRERVVLVELVAEAESIGDMMGHPADRHRDEGGRDTSLPNLGQQLACSRAPRE